MSLEGIIRATKLAVEVDLVLSHPLWIESLYEGSRRVGKLDCSLSGLLRPGAQNGDCLCSSTSLNHQTPHECRISCACTAKISF